MRAALAIVALLGLGGVAAADDQAPGQADAPAAVPAPRPVWMWSVGGLVRRTRHDGDADAKLAGLEAYGYYSQAANLTGLRGDVAYGHAPLVDLGIAWAWGRGTYGNGSQFDDPDQITGRTLELGAFARLHWVRPGAPIAAEPRVELGVARSSVDLRGASIQRVGPYTRLGVDVRMGGERGGVLLSIDHTQVWIGDDAMLDVPTGGLSVGLSMFWRYWQ